MMKQHDTTNIPMSFGERLLHTTLFELGAISIATLVILAFLPTKAHAAIGTGITLSLMAMAWNFVFNLIFDKFFDAPRQNRSFALRLFHTISFEAGLLIFTIPVVAYLLDLSLWQAFVADIGLSAIITLYALIFNWIYDNIRLKFLRTRPV